MAEPLTVVVRRRVRPGFEARFEAAMQEFIRFALSSPGHLGIYVLRPEPGGPHEYTVVDRFADVSARQAFKASAEYGNWMRQLGDLTEGEAHIKEMQGLAGWFAAHPKRPSKRKMALATFIGVYPLTSFLPPFISGLLPTWHPLLANVVTTGLIVGALSWIVMPIITRVMARWLFT
jgi:antibiotic biosynthesis monooxygenase (ABM) superfamily enzyme